MELQQLFQTVGGAVLSGSSSMAITGLEYHSQRIQPGHVFFAIHGFREDGLSYVADAASRGAVAVVSEAAAPENLAPGISSWVRVPDARRALALASCRFYGNPSGEIPLVGITGTNGKTTVSFLIASVLEQAGMRPALIGTLGNRLRFSGRPVQVATPQTTPESLDLQRLLREAIDHRGAAAVMEVSSHSLVLDRVSGCRFHTALWTTFSRDHLDFHESMENYFLAKQKLFLPSENGPAPRYAILNADDDRIDAVRKLTPAQVISFGMKPRADVSASQWNCSPARLEMTIQIPAGPMEIESPLTGAHNACNLLAAVAACIALEVPAEHIQEGLRSVTVPGRMEPIDEGQPFAVMVDYAHTDEGIRTLVATAREWTKQGRLTIVFGCGGDRDRSKRPLMGQAAAECDRVILTSDNPRTEDPVQILNDVRVGLQKGSANYLVEQDREAAIRQALLDARAGDTVLIAGKGHETWQIVGQDRMPFDDREVAGRILREMGFSPADRK